MQDAKKPSKAPKQVQNTLKKAPSPKHNLGGNPPGKSGRM